MNLLQLFFTNNNFNFRSRIKKFFILFVQVGTAYLRDKKEMLAAIGVSLLGERETDKETDEEANKETDKETFVRTEEQTDLEMCLFHCAAHKTHSTFALTFFFDYVFLLRKRRFV